MDQKIRGAIEKMMDRSFSMGQIIPAIEWIRKDLPISSQRDLALGHVIGYTQASAFTMIITTTKGIFTPEDEQEIKEMINRRIPEIVEKIEKELAR